MEEKKIRIKIVYKDGKEIILTIHEEDYENFLTNFGRGSVFDPKHGNESFWTNHKDVRCLYFYPVLKE